MSKVIKLGKYRIKSEGMAAQQARMIRAYARFKFRHYRRTKEQAKRRQI